jgi:hypothetical protein
MNADLTQSMIDIVFKGNLLYLAPVLFLLMAVTYADKLIELLVNALNADSGSSRRNRY